MTSERFHADLTKIQLTAYKYNIHNAMKLQQGFSPEYREEEYEDLIGKVDRLIKKFMAQRCRK